MVTGNYFSTLGLNPARGRFFAPEEDSIPGTHPVAVLNYVTWQKDFGGAEDIIGRQLSVNSVTLTIIGVAPPHFIGVNAMFGPNLWVPAAMAERLFPNSMQGALSDRGKAAFLAVGRLKPGVPRGRRGPILPPSQRVWRRYYPATEPAIPQPCGRSARSSWPVPGASSPLIVRRVALSMVVGIVLLIACSNVANLLLARSAARQQETGGPPGDGREPLAADPPASHRKCAAGVSGGVVGVFLAYFGLQFLFGRLPGGANFPTPKLDATVFAFALLVSLATGFLFGTIPALKASAIQCGGGVETSRAFRRTNAAAA